MKQKLTTMLFCHLLLSSGVAFGQSSMSVQGKVNNQGAVYSTSPVLVNSGSTGDAGVIINNGTIVLENGIRLYSGEDSDGMLFNLSNGIDISQSSAASIQVIKEFSQDRWYYMSFPFDVNISDIYSPAKSSLSYSLDGSGGDFWITSFNGKRRSELNSSSGNWLVIPSDGKLLAGVGYRVNLLNLSLEELIFPAASKSLVSGEGVLSTNSCSVTPSPWDSPSTRPLYKGWNMVGTQHTGTYVLSSASLTADGAFNNTAHYFDRQTQEWDHADLEDSELLMPPHFSFLVQAATSTGKLYFHPSGLDISRASQPEFRSGVSPAEKIELRISGSNGSSHTTFRFSDRYSEEVLIEEDGSKMFSGNSTDIWSQMDGEPLCVNRLPVYSSYKELPLGVSLEQGSYTIGLDRVSEGMADVVLWDRETNQRINLLEESYTFTTDQALANSKRFSLELNSKMPTGIADADSENILIYASNDYLYLKGVKSGDLIRVYDTAGVLIASLTATGSEESMPLSARGVFIVQVAGSSNTTAKVRN